MEIESRASRRMYELQKCLLEDVRISKLPIFWSSLFYATTAEDKKEF